MTRELPDDPSTQDLETLPPDDLRGQTIGGYVLSERLGQGGMGVVYLGVHPDLGKRVAVKVILGGPRDDELRRRFFDEARAAAALDSPHVVTIHDLATLPDGRLYLVMEYLEGESVAQLLRRRGRLGADEAAAIAEGALAGLAATHAAGVVHRDVKPANLFVARRGEGAVVKILDFGIAKLQGRGGPGLTRAGTVVGTPEYMAPEQAAGTGGSVDGRTDLYAMGVVLHEMMSGSPPFRSDDFAELVVAHRTQAPPPLEGVSPALTAVVKRALAKSPADRFRDANEMRAALLAAVGERISLPMPEVRAIEAVAPRVAVASPAPAATRVERRSPPRVDRAPEVPAPAPGALSREVTQRKRARWRWGAAALALAAAGAATLALLMTRGGGASATSEYCRWTIVDGTGASHRFGGARDQKRMSDRTAWTQVWMLADRYTIGCSTSVGSGYANVTLDLSPAEATIGAHDLVAPKQNLYVAFTGIPPTGIDRGSFSPTKDGIWGAPTKVGTFVLASVPDRGRQRLLEGSARATLVPDGEAAGPPIQVELQFRFTP